MELQPYTSVETELGAGVGSLAHRVPPELVRYQELELSIMISLALMKTDMLRYAATTVAYVADCGTPCSVDMGNVGEWHFRERGPYLNSVFDNFMSA